MNSAVFCTPGKPGFEHCPGARDTVAYYTQITLDGKCDIPEAKPDSANLISHRHTLEILKAETIDCLEDISEKHTLGKKVLVTGTMRLGIEYSNQSCDQGVHFFECEIPFMAVVLACHLGEECLLPSEFDLDDYLVHVCLEHFQIKQISERAFAKTAIVMIWLQPKRTNRACR